MIQLFIFTKHYDKQALHELLQAFTASCSPSRPLAALHDLLQPFTNSRTVVGSPSRTAKQLQAFTNSCRPSRPLTGLHNLLQPFTTCCSPPRTAAALRLHETSRQLCNDPALHLFTNCCRSSSSRNNSAYYLREIPSWRNTFFAKYHRRETSSSRNIATARSSSSRNDLALHLRETSLQPGLRLEGNGPALHETSRQPGLRLEGIGPALRLQEPIQLSVFTKHHDSQLFL